MSLIRTRQIFTYVIRAAGSAVALAVALSACGGGGDAGDGGVVVVGKAADGVSKLFTPSPAPLRAATANLLSNPDFEAGMTDWGDWSNSQVVDGAGASGSRALRVGAAAGGAGHDVDGILPGATRLP